MGNVLANDKVVLSVDVYHALCHILNRNDNGLPDFLYAGRKCTQNNCFNDLIKSLIYKCGYGKYLLCPDEPWDPSEDTKCKRMFFEDKHRCPARQDWT